MPNIDDYTRVTTVLCPFSGLAKVPSHILRNACTRGEKVHEICTALMEDLGMSPFDDRFSGYIESFTKWTKGKKFIERPSRLYCDKHLLTGEVDGIYEDDKGNLVLFDIKTPAHESKTWHLQGSAYAYLCKIQGYNISRIEFIQLPKDGSDAKTYEYKEDFTSFLNLLEIYNRYFKDSKSEELYLEHL